MLLTYWAFPMFLTGSGLRRLRDDAEWWGKRTSKGKFKAFTAVSKIVKSKESGIKERIPRYREAKGQKAVKRAEKDEGPKSDNETK